MKIILKYFPDLTAVQKEQLSELLVLYPDWNSKVNVISRKDIDNLEVHHILHSLAIAKFIKPSEGTRFIDVGTGGGFPGIPLAILFPECQFTLVDSIRKKTRVIDSIANSIALSNVNAVWARAEDLNGQYHFAISRAVSRLDRVWNWVSPLLSPGTINGIPQGLLYLKGGDIREETASIKQSFRHYSLSEAFKEDFFVSKGLVHILK